MARPKKDAAKDETQKKKEDTGLRSGDLVRNEVGRVVLVVDPLGDRGKDPETGEETLQAFVGLDLDAEEEPDLSKRRNRGWLTREFKKFPEGELTEPQRVKASSFRARFCFKAETTEEIVVNKPIKLDPEKVKKGWAEFEEREKARTSGE
jgi:hypothetical protein